MHCSALLRSMMTSSNGTIFHVTGPLCGEFTGPGEFPAQRPVTRSFDVFFDLRLTKRLSEQPLGWWFETPPWSLWRQCNGMRYSPSATPTRNNHVVCWACVYYIWIAITPRRSLQSVSRSRMEMTYMFLSCMKPLLTYKQFLCYWPFVSGIHHRG